MDGGDWFKLHRKLLESEVFQTSAFTILKLWDWCMCRANYRPGAWYGHVIEPGQFVTSRVQAMKELKATAGEFRWALKRLQQMGNISVITTSNFTIVTVCNWKGYQSAEQGQQPANDQPTASERPASDHNRRRKERKKGRKEEETIPSSRTEGEEQDTTFAADAAVAQAIAIEEAIHEMDDLGPDGFNCPPTTPSPRRRNELFDAVVEITGADLTLKSQGGHVAKVCKELREADPPYTPDDLRRLPQALREAYPRGGWTLTVGSITNHIHLVRNKVAIPDGEKPKCRIPSKEEWEAQK